jgi:hypothetical protein
MCVWYALFVVGTALWLGRLTLGVCSMGLLNSGREL